LSKPYLLKKLQICCTFFIFLCDIQKDRDIEEQQEWEKDKETNIHFGTQLMPSVVFLPKKLVTRACLLTKLFFLFYELRQLIIS
jgi:hypothetical protein